MTRKLHKVATKIFNYTSNGCRGSKPDTLSAVNLTLFSCSACTNAVFMHLINMPWRRLLRESKVTKPKKRSEKIPAKVWRRRMLHCYWEVFCGSCIQLTSVYLGEGRCHYCSACYITPGEGTLAYTQTYIRLHSLSALFGRWYPKTIPFFNLNAFLNLFRGLVEGLHNSPKKPLFRFVHELTKRKMLKK